MDMHFSRENYMSMLEQRHIEEAQEYRSSFTPDHLYKFYWLDEMQNGREEESSRRNERRFSALENNQLWFALPEYQNDPYEYLGMYLDKEKLVAQGFNISTIEGVEESIRKIPICCFVANSSSNMPMWAHYANNHQGYCVKYKVHNKRCVRSVLYEPERIPIASIFEGFIASARGVENGTGAIEDVQFYSSLLQEMLFIKHTSWAGEKEYRIVYPADEQISKGTYVTVPEVGLETVEIICGYKCSDTHVARLVQIAEKLNIPCRKCSISDTEFTVYDEV